MGQSFARGGHDAFRRPKVRAVPREFLHFILFGLDGLAVGIGGWIAARVVAPGASGTLERVVAWGLTTLGWLVASGVVLGAVGGLGPLGFAAAHGLGLGVLLGWRGGRVRQDAADAREALRGVRSWGGWTPSGLAAAGLGLAWVALGALALWAQPAVYDALAYRLPRIAGWLQEGRVVFFGTDDPRLDYMTVGPDLVMAWLIAPWTGGYLPVALAQWAGGGLALVVTVGLARDVGLGRGAAIGAAALMMGMANVAVQFTSAHTDLFTAGIGAAALWLGGRAWGRGEAPVLAGWGVGLALGSKGTVLYLVPTVVGWCTLLAWRRRVSVGWWVRGAGAAAVGTLVFAGPTYWSNLRHFGGPFGPAAQVQQHHGGSFVEKLGPNLRSALIQSLEPHSQPGPWAAAAGAAGARLAAGEADDDRLMWGGLRRQGTLRGIMMRATPDADVVTFGVLPLLLFAGAVVRAVRRDSSGARQVLAWGVGLAVFAVFFHGMQRWHPFGYRYFVLVAPWLAAGAAWGLEAFPGRWRVGGWVVAVIAGLWVGGEVNVRALQTGWRAAVRPEAYAPYRVAEEWRRWVRGLEPVGGALTVALPENRPLAAFFRDATATPRPVRLVALSAERFATAEGAARAHGGWVIVPAATYLGREGGAVTRVWLDGGDEAGAFSLAAYRVSAPGEGAGLVVYRCRPGSGASQPHWSLLVRPGVGGRVAVKIENEAAEVRAGRIRTAGGVMPFTLGGRAATTMLVPLRPGEVSEIVVEFAAGGALPRVTAEEPVGP